MSQWLKGMAIIPFVHLGLCYIYLYFYLSAFGDRVVQISSIQNIYSVGLGKILPAYMFFFGTMFIAHLWNDKEPLHIVGRTDFERHPSLDNKWLNRMMFSLPFIVFVGLIIQYFSNNTIILFSILFLVIPIFAYLQGKIFHKNNFPRIYRLPILMIFIGISQIIIDAYGDGFRDRHRPYSYFSEDLAKCANDSKILSPIGSYFLAVTKADKRVIVDIDCKEIFHFPKRKIIINVI